MTATVLFFMIITTAATRGLADMPAAGSAQAVTQTPAQSAPAKATMATSSTSAPPAVSSASTAPPIKAEPPAAPNMAIVGVGAGLSGTLLVMGAVFTVLPNVRTRVVANTIEDRVFFINVGAWSFIVASTLGAATIMYTIVTSNRGKPGVRAVPVMTASGGGLVLRGDW